MSLYQVFIIVFGGQKVGGRGWVGQGTLMHINIDYLCVLLTGHAPRCPIMQTAFILLVDATIFCSSTLYASVHSSLYPSGSLRFLLVFAIFGCQRHKSSSDYNPFALTSRRDKRLSKRERQFINRRQNCLPYLLAPHTFSPPICLASSI
jgi:hypothetical protein